MADGFNKAILIGRLGTDPELRYTTGGRAILKFRMATNESWKDARGEKQERTDWHNVVIWGKRAEALNGILSKGRRIGIDGRIRTSSYEAKEGGGKRYRVDIEAQNVVLLDGRRSLETAVARSDGRDEAPADRDAYSPEPENAAGGEDIPF
jgi:single-strand DNA-binding protein